jgi:hypothetical protein
VSVSAGGGPAWTAVAPPVACRSGSGPQGGGGWSGPSSPLQCTTGAAHCSPPVSRSVCGDAVDVLVDQHLVVAAIRVVRPLPRIRAPRRCRECLNFPGRRSYPVSAGAARCRLSSTVVAVRVRSWCSVPARANPFVSEWLARSRSEGDHDRPPGLGPADVTVMGRRAARSRSCHPTGPPERVLSGRAW